MSTTVRVRFAPSPTGRLHIGGARTALFNWAYARGRGGVFLLRIEDTDPERSRPEYEAEILEALRWLGLDWDEGPDVGGPHGPYRQSERSGSYRRAAESLLAAGRAYPCFCPPERLERLRERQQREGRAVAYDGHCRDLSEADRLGRSEAGERPVVRFRVPAGETRFRDLIRGDVSFRNADVDDWIMLRADGTPTYNFVVVCDDSAMRITHVLRGEEHLTNTPKQVLLCAALGFSAPVFAHFPLMLGSDRKKLSKRTGDTALQDYRDRGYPPEAVLNFLCLQGWALDDKTEIFSADELVANFDVADVGKGGAVFDPEKFLWMCGEYIRADDIERVADRCASYLVEAGLASAVEIAAGGAQRGRYLAAVRLVKERIHTYAELPERLAWLFAADDAVRYDARAVKNARKHDGFERILADYLAWLSPHLEGGADAAALRDATRAWAGAAGLELPALFQPLRCVLTGDAGGPDLFDVMALLGPGRTATRVEVGIARLSDSG